MSERHIADEITTIITGGHATTQLALSWLWYELCRHPDSADRMEAEVTQVIGNRQPVLADVANLPYTRQVVAEALRLYPPDSLVVRRVVGGDQQIGDSTLREGSFLYIVPWLLQRDARWWSAPPEHFVPERWQHASPHIPGAYLPFSAGASSCIGQQLALLEMALVSACIAQRFRVSLPPDFPQVSPQLVAVNLHPHPTPHIFVSPLYTLITMRI